MLFLFLVHDTQASHIENVGVSYFNFFSKVPETAGNRRKPPEIAGTSGELPVR